MKRVNTVEPSLGEGSLQFLSPRLCRVLAAAIALRDRVRAAGNPRLRVSQAAMEGSCHPSAALASAPLPDSKQGRSSLSPLRSPTGQVAERGNLNPIASNRFVSLATARLVVSVGATATMTFSEPRFAFNR